MRYITRYGLAAAVTIPTLAACADSLAPPPSRSAPSPIFDAVPIWFCQPCAPGLVCAAVCLPDSSVVIVDPVPDATITLPPDPTRQR
jgi:hypothetical protein